MMGVLGDRDHGGGFDGLRPIGQMNNARSVIHEIGLVPVTVRGGCLVNRSLQFHVSNRKAGYFVLVIRFSLLERSDECSELFSHGSALP